MRRIQLFIIYYIKHKDSTSFKPHNPVRFLKNDYFHFINSIGGRWSQDGGLGRNGIRVSAQLGRLPGTGGGPQTPKWMGENPSNWVGHGAWWGSEGGGEVEVGWDWLP